LRKDSGELEI